MGDSHGWTSALCAADLEIEEVVELDFLKVLRFSFPVPVVGSSSLLQQKT